MNNSRVVGHVSRRGGGRLTELGQGLLVGFFVIALALITIALLTYFLFSGDFHFSFLSARSASSAVK